MFNRPRLLAPGPVETDPRTALALAAPQIHHRTPEARAALQEARSRLGQLLGGGLEVLITASSGTGAFEAAMVSLLSPGARLVCAEAGKFGERWGKMGEALGYTVDYVRAPWGEVLDPQAVAEAVPGAAALLITHSETATGVLHDLEAIARAARAANPDLLILVDAVTSFAVAELRPQAWDLDAVVSGSQKGVALPPGLGFVALSPRALDHLASGGPRYYFDLARELKSQQKGETAYTPAINLIQALNLSTDRLLALPLEELWAEKARMNAALLAAGEALGCRVFARRPSPAVAALVPPEGVSGKQVSEALKALGARAAAGQDAYKDSMFRISLMGYFDRYDALAVAGLLEDAFSALGQRFERGVAVAAAWQVFAGTQVVGRRT
ncbi:aspartate aminotransferase-like enzyme [Deinobacterium chartae]|uniref:Aspartate aminotransferase-like enzyme n=1 Tax=Deinobacterium chartae TaxID=521158 RepID=A0A841HX20_9DEIO|nr:alanine--glyoxylate aminotransferase family protein [Deinobacterium chartae]MBB6097947.1 aspartate aminotransferase-like enzyme [Deinobacterium chartae]